MMGNSERRWNLGLASILVIVGLSIAAAAVQIYDKQLFSLLNSFHSPLTDIFWLSFTTLGDGLLICMILGCFLFINPRITVMGLAVFFLSSVAVNVVKAFFPCPRPLEIMQYVHVVGPLLRWGSFPSGHTAAGFSACFVLMGYAQGNAAKSLVLAVASLIGLSRIFVGAHFPTDVLWGMIFALITYNIVKMTLDKTIEKLVPDQPDFGHRVFRPLIYAQLAATLFGLLVYSVKFAEYAPAALAISIGTLVFMALKMHELAPFSRDN